MADYDSFALEDSGQLREGLPPSYRMRADRHYVDLLASAAPAGAGVERRVAIAALEAPGIDDVPALVPLIESVRQHGVLQPLLVREGRGTMRVIAGQKRLAAAIAAGLREVPCIVHDVDDETAARMRAASNVTTSPEPPSPEVVALEGVNVDEDVSRSLTAASALAELCTGPVSDLSRGVLGNLLRAELWRASMLVQASRALKPDVRVVRAAVPVAQMVERVVQGLAPERRIRHSQIDTHLDLPPGHVVIADEPLLATALGSAVVATLALIDGLVASRILIVASLAPSRGLTLVVAQDHVVPARPWVERAFDVAWHERPGGATAALGCAAVQQTARAHGGDAAVSATPKGSRISLTIPAGA